MYRNTAHQWGSFLRFQSSHIMGFLAGGLVLTALASAWSWKVVRETQWESVQEQEIELVMTAIEGGALRFAQLNSARLASDFLASHFAAASQPGTEPRFLSATIRGGPGASEVYAAWEAAGRARVPSSCSRAFGRAFSPPGALFPYRVTVESNACWENPVLVRLVQSAFLVPLVLAAGLLGVLGSCLLAMMASVRRAEWILRSTPDPGRVLALAEGVPWLQVRDMVKRALETKGANLHYFQAIIEEAEHDILRQLSQQGKPRRGRDRDDGEASEGDGRDSSPAIITRILRKLVHDSRLGEASGGGAVHAPSGSTALKTADDVATFVATQGIKAETVGKGATGVVPRFHLDEGALERLLLNLASNARRHGQPASARAIIQFEGERLTICFKNRVSLRQGIGLVLNAATGGIDPHSPGKPLVRSWWGRQGIGTRIMKKALETLSAEMSARVTWRSFEVTVAIPVRPMPTGTLEPHGQVRGRLAAFLDGGLENAARLAGLESYLRPAFELRSLVAAGAVAEVMVDFPLPEAPESVIVREVRSAARVRGVAKFWQGDAT